VVVFGLILGGYAWFLGKMERVKNGTAKPNFPYSDYSLAELNDLYPQTLNEKVQTTQTPEQTFAKFISAVKAGDFTTASECCFKESKQAEIITGLKKLQASGKLSEMLNDLSGGIKPDFVGDTKATYLFTSLKGGDQVAGGITFIKNSQGAWLIDSL
jgi:hypothetical protein